MAREGYLIGNLISENHASGNNCRFKYMAIFPTYALLDELPLVKTMLVEILPIISSCQGIETAPVLKRL